MFNKFLITLLMAIVMVNCNHKKSKSYTIKGTMEHEDIDSVFIYNVNEETLSSTAIKDGKFTLTGSVEEPQKVIVGNFDKQLSLTVILVNGNHTIDFGKENVKVVAGKAHNTIYGFYNSDEYKKLYDAYQNAINVVMTNTDPEKVKELEKEAEAKEKIVFEYECAQYRKIIEGNYPTKTKLFALSSTYDWDNYPIEKQLKMLDEYEKEIGKTLLIENHRTYLNAPLVLPNSDNRVAPNIGDVYKNITAYSADGNPIKLSEVLAKNEYVILEFWASWCMPCRAEIPNLNKAYEKYKTKGLEIFSVSLDKKLEEWKQILKEENTPWINAVGENEFNSVSAFEYGVTAIPSSFLISKDGKIVAKDSQLRGEMLNTKLTEFLK